MSTRLLGAKQRFNKESFQLAQNLRSARYSPFVISKVLAARMRKLIIAHAHKKKTDCSHARKDRSIPYNCHVSQAFHSLIYLSGEPEQRPTEHLRDTLLQVADRITSLQNNQNNHSEGKVD